MARAAGQQPAGAADGQHRGAGPRNFRPSRIQKSRHILNFRFPRHAAQRRISFGAGGRHQQRQGGPHTGQPQRVIHRVQRAAPPQRDRLRPCLHRSPHGGQAVKVDVDRPRPKPAPAGQRHCDGAGPDQERRQIKNRSPHCSGHRRRDIAAKRPRRKPDGIALQFGRRADRPQQRKAGGHIRQRRHTRNGAGFTAEQRGSQQRQHAVFLPLPAGCTPAAPARL